MDFFTNRRVKAAVAVAKALKAQSKPFSDILDQDGNQYVDLVMEGGGVLGIALTGYSYVLEQAGIRFLGLGGTSAGAINALMMAALGPPDQAKTARMVGILANMPMHTFIDGDQDARDFSQAVLEKAKMTKLLWKAMQVIDNLKDDLGLNPGARFYEWLSEELARLGIRTLADLEANLTLPIRLRVRQDDGSTRPVTAADEINNLLAIIAADITTETKAQFPAMAKLYWQDPASVNPACFARASMSIPLFFHPFVVKDCPQDRQAWLELANYAGRLPDEVMFIDGGIMSNFPIDVFHQPLRVPLSPSFGAKIGMERHEPAKIDKPGKLLTAVFDAARHTLDNDFIKQNPDYVHLVKMIDTGEHNWLRFDLPPEDKVDLFARGAEAAAQFLTGFDWPKYKKVREDLRNARLR